MRNAHRCTTATRRAVLATLLLDLVNSCISHIFATDYRRNVCVATASKGGARGCEVTLQVIKPSFHLKLEQRTYQDDLVWPIETRRRWQRPPQPESKTTLKIMASSPVSRSTFQNRLRYTLLHKNVFSIQSSRYSMMLRVWTENDSADRNHDDNNYKMDARPETRMPPCTWNQQSEAIARHRGCF